VHIPNVHVREALCWIYVGLERVWREPVRWLGMTLVYLAIALVLTRIPFLGNFVLVFLTPIMLASAMIVARNEPKPHPAWWRGVAHALTDGALRELFRVFRSEARAVTIVIVCIVTMGLFVLVNIPELLLTGGSVLSGLAGPSLATTLPLSVLLGMVVVSALYLVLAMSLLYIVPLTVFRHHQAIPALAESFRTCVQHRKSLALFVAPFFGVYAAIVVAMSYGHWIGQLLLVTLGIVAIPVFVAALHRSYQELLETPAAAHINSAAA
jgi:hypothetical protein